MKVFKEILCMVLIAAVMLMVLVLVFYDYITDSNNVPEVNKYTQSSDLKEALSDKETFEEEEKSMVVGSLTKSAYNIDNRDINSYISEGLLKQGKVNPFANSESLTTQNSSNGNSSSNNSTGNSGSTSTTATQNGTTTTTTTSGNQVQNQKNSDSTGTFFEKPGMK